jgi:xylan 1,4-beta-xylosidase
LAIRAFRRGAAGEPTTGRTLALMRIAAAAGAPVRLRVVARGGRYDLDYALGTGPWVPAARSVDGTNLSTARAGGFTGTMIGPFARD